MNTKMFAADDRLCAEATQWRTQLLATPDDAALGQQVDAWLAQSTAHRLAYAEVAELEYLLQLLPSGVSTHPPLRVPLQRRGAVRLIWYAAQTLVALVLLAWSWLNLPGLLQNWRADQFTAVGQVESFTLSDGSILVLDSDSAVRLDMDDARREVQLWRGAAYVQVKADPARPFVLRTSTVAATALGTAYSVEVDTSLVTVEHGRVRLTGDPGTVELAAGQSARPAAAGWQVVPASGAGTAPDWTRGHRAFAQRPLREVLLAIDRYLPGRMWLRDSAVLEQSVTAVFDLADPALALMQLCNAHGLRAQFWPGLIVIDAL